jgi:hypothetical protein
MLTFFTTAKPFVGHSGMIQRNALQSWKLLHPAVELILFGNEEGAAEVCTELGLRHEPHVERHETGSKYVNYMFERAQQIARYDCLCYSNCDIMFFSDFYEAVRLISDRRQRFLMIGQRWDADITEPVDFKNPEWALSLRQFARTKALKQAADFVDYFVFSKGLYDNVPPLVVGRSFWDWWLVWKALSMNASVIDCTAFVFAIHQNHGYGYHPQGKQGTHEDVLALRNIEVGGGKEHLRFTIDSTHRLDRLGNIRSRSVYRRWGARRWDAVKRKLQPGRQVLRQVLIYDVWLPVWHFCLDLSRPIRNRLGLRSEALSRSRQKDSSGVGPPL